MGIETIKSSNRFLIESRAEQPGSALPEFPWLHDSIPYHRLIPSGKTPGIQLHSSQNNNVVLFFVVRATSQDETNPLITKHLQTVLQISTDSSVEKYPARGIPVVEFPLGGRLVVVGQFTR